MSHFSLHPFFSSCSACALSPQCSGRWAQGVNWVKVISWARLGRPGLPSPAWTKTTTWQLGLYHEHISQDIFCTSFPIYLLKPASHTCVSQSWGPPPPQVGRQKKCKHKNFGCICRSCVVAQPRLGSLPPSDTPPYNYLQLGPSKKSNMSHCKVCA